MRRSFLLSLMAALLAAPLLTALPPFIDAALAQGGPIAEPTGPQPQLPREPLTIITRDGKRHAFQVEMALTPQQQTIGLMFRTEVPADGGMLFDWGAERQAQMWMKNTLVPLDMVFIAGDGTIRSIAENTVPRSLANIDARFPVRGTLELAAGATAKLNIRVGDKVENRIFTNAG